MPAPTAPRPSASRPHAAHRGAAYRGLPRRACARLALVAVLWTAAARGAAARGDLPPIVLVSRCAPGSAAAGQIPGLGPHGRALAPGGRLMVRERDGRLRALLPEGALWDASDPAVAPDGRRIAFAGSPAPDSAWRIYLVDADGRDLHALTRSDREVDLSSWGAGAARFDRYDDFDPCWIGPHELVFASTRFPLIAEYGDVLATNLFRVHDSGAPPVRLTAERNGIEEPAFDRASGRVVASRWWTNRWKASNLEASGITTDPARALPADSANLWQAVSLDPALRDPVLAAGDPRRRADSFSYQPALLAGGAIACVYARHLALSPAPGGVGVELFGGPTAPRFPGLPRAIGPPRRLVGPVPPVSTRDPYHEARGLAAPQACSPAALPDGRILFAFDPGARGDFGVWVMSANGSGREPVADLPGTLELDPAPILPWDAGSRAWREPPADRRAALDAASARPPARREEIENHDLPGFTFHALNLFANAAVDAPLPDAPPPGPGLRMRFFAALSRPAAEGGDSVVLLREVAVSPGGEVDAPGLPAGVPMFEQVVRPDGSVLMSAHGPAHVAGFNAGGGGERRCVGCHIGHSAQPVPATLEAARWFNAAPGASVAASSVAPGTAGARAAVDRRTRGSPAEVAWIAAGGPDPWLRLSWPLAIEVRELVLYFTASGRPAWGAAGVPCEIRLLREGRGLGIARAALAPGAGEMRVSLEPRIVDAIELSFPRAAAARNAPLSLAEVEVIARVP